MDTEQLKKLILTDYADRFASAEDAMEFYKITNANILSADNYINLDADDLYSVLGGSDRVYIATVEGDMDSIARLLNEAHSSIKAADGMKFCKLMMQLQFARNSGFTIDKTYQITEFISSLPSDEVDVIWGTGFDDNLGNNVRFTLIEGFNA